MFKRCLQLLPTNQQRLNKGVSPNSWTKSGAIFPCCGHYKHIPLHSSTDGGSSPHYNIAEHVHVLCCYNSVCCLRLFKQPSYAIFVPVFIYFLFTKYYVFISLSNYYLRSSAGKGFTGKTNTHVSACMWCAISVSL